VTIGTEKGHVERLVIAPVVSFEPPVTMTPRAAVWPKYETKLFGESRSVACGTRSNSPGFRRVGTNIKMAVETCDFGMLTVATSFLHGRFSAQVFWTPLDKATQRLRFPLR